jgi:hypothetical protein
MKREFTVEARVDAGAWPKVRDSLLRVLADLAAA